MSFSRYFGIIEYNGMLFGGSQTQTNSRLPTVQTLLNSALSRFTQTLPFKGVQMGSRLDKGVNAKGLTFHFDFPNQSPPRKNRGSIPIPPRNPFLIQKSVNSYFRQRFSYNIRVRDILLVSPLFHSRKDATGRIYQYKLLFVHPNSNYPVCSFAHDHHIIYSETYPTERSLNQIFKPFVGSFLNFNSFRSANCSAKSPIRKIDFIHASIKQLEENHIIVNSQKLDSLPYRPPSKFTYYGDSSKEWPDPIDSNETSTKYGYPTPVSVEITLRGRSWLYNQVRNMIAFFIEQALCSNPFSNPLESLDLPRKLLPPPLPPHGLTLLATMYDDTDWQHDFNVYDTNIRI